MSNSINGYTRQYTQSVSERNEQSVRDRLLSVRGQRYMQPTYGTDIAGAQGGVARPELIAGITAQVAEALAPETDLDVVGISVVLSPEQRDVDIIINGDLSVTL